MRAKIHDRRWSRQKWRKKRMLSKTSNSQPIEKPVKHALEHGSHMRTKPIFESGESERNEFARRLLHPKDSKPHRHVPHASLPPLPPTPQSPPLPSPHS